MSDATSAGIPAALAWFRGRRAGLSISLAAHALLLTLAFLTYSAKFSELEAPPPESMSVEVVSPGEFARATAPVEPAIPPAANQPVMPSLQTKPRELVAPRQPLTRATTILSGAALDRIAKASLKRLSGDAAFEQLCDIEAMEQIARSDSRHTPERAIAYASSETRIEGDTLIADGGAFLSRGHWYHLAFRCSGTRDRRKVSAFEFAVGTQIPDGDPTLPTDSDDDD